MTDARNAPAVVRRITDALPQAESWARQLAGAQFDPDGTMVEIRPDAQAPAVPVDDGPLPGRYVVVDAADAPTGEVLVWVEAGRLSSAEYAWYTEDPPTAWPDPASVRLDLA